MHTKSEIVNFTKCIMQQIFTKLILINYVQIVLYSIVIVHDTSIKIEIEK